MYIGTLYQLISTLIKTITKYSNLIGYQQQFLSTKRDVYASCLCLGSVIAQFRYFKIASVWAV